MKFELGKLCLSQNIAEQLEDNESFAIEINRVVSLYIDTDFSEMEHPVDIEQNRWAIETGKGRIFATYQTSEGKIYIITEQDRSRTTILFSEEY